MFAAGERAELAGAVGALRARWGRARLSGVVAETPLVAPNGSGIVPFPNPVAALLDGDDACTTPPPPPSPSTGPPTTAPPETKDAGAAQGATPVSGRPDYTG